MASVVCSSSSRLQPPCNFLVVDSKAKNACDDDVDGVAAQLLKTIESEKKRTIITSPREFSAFHDYV